MQYVVSNQQMKEAERRCNESGTSYYQMMENAGTRCAEFILGTIPVSADILVMCGAGNNGGDGLVITRLLRQNGRNAAVLLVSGAPKTADAAENLRRLPAGTPVYQPEQDRKSTRLNSSHSV